MLRDEWGYGGFVVSDWDSIRQLQVHGLTENDRESAFEAASAGVDMEMAGDAFSHHLESSGQMMAASSIDGIDSAVRRIFCVRSSVWACLKSRLHDPGSAAAGRERRRARDRCQGRPRRESVVMLKNDHGVLPLSAESSAIRSP